MKFPLVAVKAKNGRQVGQRFEASRRDARLLKALGWAEDAPAESPVMTTYNTGVVTTPKAPAKKAAPKKAAVKPATRRTYKTRQLKAKG